MKEEEGKLSTPMKRVEKLENDSPSYMSGEENAYRLVDSRGTDKRWQYLAQIPRLPQSRGRRAP